MSAISHESYMQAFERQPVLDKGEIWLDDSLPSRHAPTFRGNGRGLSGFDAEVVKRARASRGVVGHDDPARTFEADRNLLRYMMRHRHTSPFEFVQMTFGIKAPIFVARQWIRHRMSSTNELSLRYEALAEPEFYFPARWRAQSTLNKQGSEGLVDDEHGCAVDYLEGTAHAANAYGKLIAHGASNELARLGLTLSTYTSWWWRIDMHNLLHFLSLRNKPSAQYEIQVYAQRIAEIVAHLAPETWSAYQDYREQAITFTRHELDAMRKGVPELVGCTLREQREFDAKRKAIGWE